MNLSKKTGIPEPWLFNISIEKIIDFLQKSGWEFLDKHDTGITFKRQSGDKTIVIPTEKENRYFYLRVLDFLKHLIDIEKEGIRLLLIDYFQ